MYANYLMLFGLSYQIDSNSIIKIAQSLIPAYVLIGIGGYFMNDLFDIKADLYSNKFNITNLINKYLVSIIILILWSIGFYLIWNLSAIASYLLLGQYMLLLIYSLPLIRLKERGYLGLVTDALYAHLLPATILLFILNKYVAISPYITIIFTGFTLVLGLRDIIIHQIEDAKNDIKSKTKTFAVNNQESLQKTIAIINKIAALILCILLFFIQRDVSNRIIMWSAACLTVSYLITFFRFKQLPKDSLINNYIVISSTALFLLSVNRENYVLILLLLHPYVIQKIRSTGNYFFITLFPLAINYSLFYVFILFGRNLRKKPFIKKNYKP